jgi:aconitate hydratase
MTFSFIS